MEQQRFFLVLALSFLMFLAYDAWQRDFGPKPAPQVISNNVVNNNAPVSNDVPQGADSPAVPVAGAVPTEMKAMPALQQAQRIIVNTDVLHVEIDSRGGDIRVVDLLNYPKSSKGDKTPFRLMSDNNQDLFIAQSGFTGKRERNDGTLVAAPHHNTIYQVEKTQYSLENGQEKINVALYWRSQQGVSFVKNYEFTRGSYLINVSHTINNQTGSLWRGNLYQQLQRKDFANENESSFIYTYTGGVIYDPEEKYQKIDFSDMEDEDLNTESKQGWAAMIQHYFLAAWVPPADNTFNYFSRNLGQSRYVLGMKAANELQVNAGTTATISNGLFIGPKIQKQLEAVAPGLELTVDFGALTFIAKPLFWLLDFIHGFVNNWGWAIILLTIVIKLVFYKLSEASYKSMANMRKIQPRLVALKERYGDDRQKMNQAMMEMYKKDKINPLGGCLPILVQIPVFIALYWVLLESVELRQADWILWLNDLSTADPYFVLPLLMGITMLIQQKLNPAPLDPMQAKIMMALPIVFTVFFAFFPAGLVLYWVVNNTLSIAQQWYITRIVIKA